MKVKAQTSRLRSPSSRGRLYAAADILFYFVPLFFSTQEQVEIKMPLKTIDATSQVTTYIFSKIMFTLVQLF